MITEDYVSFETAKLLKEKGFDLSEFHGKWAIDYDNIPHDENNTEGEIIIAEWHYPLITLQMAMKWLREKHKLGVFPTTYYREMSGTVRHDYGSTIVRLDSFEIIGNSKNVEDYTFEADTYEETAEKAIRYCLENLI